MYMQNGRENQVFTGGPIANADPHFSRIWMRALLRAIHDKVPTLAKVEGVFEGGDLHVTYESASMAEVAKAILELFVRQPDVFEEVNARLEQAIVGLHQGMHVLPQEGLASRSAAELWQYYQRHEELHEACSAHGWPAIMPEQAGGLFSAWLADRVPDGRDRAWLLEADDETTDEQEQRDLLLLAADIQAVPGLAAAFAESATRKNYNGLLASLDARWLHRLEDHHRRYCFVHWSRRGALPLSEYVDDIAQVLSHGTDAQEQLRLHAARRAEARANRDEALSRLALSETEKRFIAAYRKAVALKPMRRYAQQYALYRLDAVLEEIARRLSVDAATLRWLLPHEVEAALLRGAAVPAEAVRRRLGSVYRADRQGHRFEIFQSATAQAVRIDRSAPVNELRGVTASRGFGSGPVFFLRGEEALPLVPDGAVLVIEQARPEYTQAFKKAVAVVCEQGGVTSHTALIARELGVPCLVAAKRASVVLQDGMVVEVDANRGLVRIV